MINWPCIFKLEGDDELMLINSEVELTEECDSLIWSDSDVLIDSCGYSFSIVDISTEQASSFQVIPTQATPAQTTPDQVNAGQLIPFKLKLIQLKRTYDLNEITQLIQAHEFSKAEMCLTKIQFSSIANAISALANEKRRE